ncbi:hypothetical protein Tdes44962_MAKER00627 [Teratosphaeria destructans]|uniref:Uncharacterized protein n=1 Tax=Teratosphaeria destructans TaxID=418781 RepID=A0A9W7W0E6_9PEZI|nr:hypothetical protein Tdes44962_MAKER00627 [Teratosphaeria destructans]
MDHDTIIDGWKAQWIQRTLPGFVYYSLSMTVGLSMLVGLIAILNIRTMRPLRRELAGMTSASDCAGLYSRFDRCTKIACHRHYAVAWAYMINFLAIAMVDMYISTTALTKEAAELSILWTWEAILLVATVVGVSTAGFVAAFVLVPLAQMLFATWALNRFAQKNGSETLSKYIPLARIYSTHAAQLWAMACFLITAFWPSFDDTPVRFVRWLILEACVGSACAWIDASTAFNFASEKLEDFELGNTRLRHILQMFAQTAAAAHTSEKSGDLLPRYEDASEKSTLLVSGLH